MSKPIKTNIPKCIKCGEPNYTEQAFGKCDLCYDCAEEEGARKMAENFSRIYDKTFGRNTRK